jgi:hypothetical protein
MKYRKKPVVIEARQLHFDTSLQEDLREWCGGFKGPDGGVFIHTLEGRMLAVTGDYIIKGVNGEFYPCKPNIFEKTYDLVE